MLAIIDYGMGNINSIYYKLIKHISDVVVTNDKDEIKRADKIILPGVGHFAKGMENLRDLKIIDILNDKVLNERTPILGICLGMQLLTEHSEEGNVTGLGWIKGNTKLFNFKENKEDYPVPNVGWRKIIIRQDKDALLKGFTSEDKFYFTHSYFVKCRDESDISSTTEYGIEFVSSVKRDNISGMQFHPEKSHLRGFEILKRFVGVVNIE